MTRVLSVLAAMMLALVAPVAAQTYPDKPIRVIVPFPAGGGGDTLARLVMNKVGEVLGVTIVIDNRAGAGGNIGTEAAARAEPEAIRSPMAPTERMPSITRSTSERASTRSATLRRSLVSHKSP
jgi:tripartite-type tricarboxylate transporter receptor subunit TctC